MSQKTNDQIILEQIVTEKCLELGDGTTLSEYFEIYSASEILKDFDLTYDDIKYGIVGDGGDGGIDSIFTFLNGELIKEDSEINYNQKKNEIELVLIQSKTSFSFQENAVVKFRETADDLFNLANNTKDFSIRYNQELIDRVNIFRDLYSKIAITFPKLIVRYYYATQGDTPHPNVEGKVSKLQESIGRMFSSSNFSFEFIGAKGLLELTRNIPSTSRVLEVSESLSIASGSYVCLVTLPKYYEFISDSGALARSVFESNVRDYQGSITVNTGIRATLRNPNSENFWYLNNGVTIITPKAVLGGKRLTIEDPQIVNGLQTSHELHKYFSELSSIPNDERTVLVRVICESKEEARDRIIRATNSQTSIPPASLRSSDEIHRNIEDYLKVNGYYYDRKKNHYKNQGMPVAKTISIPYLAQAMMAIILLKPDSARARPSTLINSDTEYKRIFSLEMPIDVYLKVIKIAKEVENYLKPTACGHDLERKVVTNIKYYVTMLLGIKIAGGKSNIAHKVSSLNNINITEAMLKSALETTIEKFTSLGGSDQVAKGSELVAALLEDEIN